MTYDFAVLTAQSAPTRADVHQHYLAMRDAPRGPAPAAVNRFITDLVTRFDLAADPHNGFLMENPVSDARGTVVCTSWQTLATNIRAMLELTRDHGLLLYDPQLERLYDARRRVDVEVTLGDGITVPYLSEALLAEYIARPARDMPFIVVRRDGDHYAQAYLHPNRPFDVEYRAGGPDAHYVATTTDRDLVRTVLWQWTIGAEGWRDAVAWRRADV